MSKETDIEYKEVSNWYKTDLRVFMRIYVNGLVNSHNL